MTTVGTTKPTSGRKYLTLMSVPFCVSGDSRFGVDHGLVAHLRLGHELTNATLTIAGHMGVPFGVGLALRTFPR